MLHFVLIPCYENQIFILMLDAKDTCTCEVDLNINTHSCEFYTYFHTFLHWGFILYSEEADFCESQRKQGLCCFNCLIHHLPSLFPIAITYGTMSGLVATAQ